MSDAKKWLNEVLRPPERVLAKEREHVSLAVASMICDLISERTGMGRNTIANELGVSEEQVEHVLNGGVTLATLSDILVSLGRALHITDVPLYRACDRCAGVGGYGSPSGRLRICQNCKGTGASDDVSSSGAHPAFEDDTEGKP